MRLAQAIERDVDRSRDAQALTADRADDPPGNLVGGPRDDKAARPFAEELRLAQLGFDRGAEPRCKAALS